jgi:hypothetical protein
VRAALFFLLLAPAAWGQPAPWDVSGLRRYDDREYLRRELSRRELPDDLRDSVAARGLVGGTSSKPWRKPEIHGSARLRLTKDESQGYDGGQASQFVSLQGANVFSEKVSFAFDGRGRYEYQKSSYGTEKRSTMDPYQAYVGLQQLAGTSLKLGRQYFFSGYSTAHMDGAAADWQPAAWLTLSGFAGRPVVLSRGAAPADSFRGGGLKLGSGRKGYVQLSLLLAAQKEQIGRAHV